MFDVSFIELLVIFVVALVVLGPDKLPGAVRTGALWFGRAKRSFNKVKSEIEQQLNADEIRRQLHNESILADIEEARKNADKLVKDTQKQLDQTREGINKAVTTANSPAIAVVTNSAEEGVPTYSVPEKDSASKSNAETALPEPAPAITESSTDETTDADTQTAQNVAPEAEAEPAPAPVQDIYNSAPTGRVTVQAGKVRAAQPAAPAERKDS